MKELNQNELYEIDGGLFEVLIIIGISYGMYLKMKQEGFNSKSFAKWS